MGQESLGTAAIITLEDVSELDIDLERITKLENYNTSSHLGISVNRIRKKLNKDIEKRANKINADLAIIVSYDDAYGWPFQRGCSVDFYKYN